MSMIVIYSPALLTGSYRGQPYTIPANTPTAIPHQLARHLGRLRRGVMFAGSTAFQTGPLVAAPVDTKPRAGD